jgi:hypothetical protein
MRALFPIIDESQKPCGDSSSTEIWKAFRPIEIALPLTELAIREWGIASTKLWTGRVRKE